MSNRTCFSNRFLTLLGTALILFTSFKLQAQVSMAFFDWDGTIVEHRQSQKGVFSTPHILFRIDDVGQHLLVGLDLTPRELEVSQQEYHRMHPWLAKKNGQPITVNRMITLDNGQQVRPALYYERFPDTFARFRESPDAKRNYLLEAFKEAERRGQNREFMGRYWDVMAAWCSTEETAKFFYILTARGHSEQEWNALFKYMIKRRYIRFRPGHVINMSRKEFDRYGLPGHMAERKGNFLLEQIRALTDVDLPVGAKHEIIVADDEQRNVQRFVEIFRRVAYAAQNPIQLVLGNSGLRTDIRESILTEHSVIESEGSFRSTGKWNLFPPAQRAAARAQAEQRATAPPDRAPNPQPSVKPRALSSCQLLFSSGGGAL